MSVAVDAGGRSFHSLMVLGMNENCAVCCTVMFGVDGRGFDADDLEVAVVFWQLILHCGPRCSLSSTACRVSPSFASVGRWASSTGSLLR